MFQYLILTTKSDINDNVTFFQKKEFQGVATSRLVYTPAIEDDGRYLACRVLAGGRIKESLEDTWEIKVLCEQLNKNNLILTTSPFLQISQEFPFALESLWTLTI